MKKAFSFMLACLLCWLALPVKAADPADFLPAKSAVLLYLDGARLSSLTWVKELLEKDKDFAAKSKQLDAIYAKYKVSEKDLFAGACYLTGNGDTPAVYIKTNIPEATLPALVSDIAAQEKSGKLSVTDKTVAGKKVYCFKFETKKVEADGEVDHDSTEFALTYLAPDVVLGFDPDEGEKVLKAAVGKPALLAKLDRKQLLSMAVDPTKDKDMKELAQEFTQAVLNLNLSGAAQKDLSLVGVIDFSAKEKAQQAGSQIQMGVPMFVGMIFGKDAELAGKLMQSLKVTMPSEKKLNVSIQLPEATIKAVGEYLQKPENLPNFGQPSVGGAAEPQAPAPAKAQ